MSQVCALTFLCVAAEWITGLSCGNQGHQAPQQDFPSRRPHLLLSSGSDRPTSQVCCRRAMGPEEGWRVFPPALHGSSLLRRACAHLPWGGGCRGEGHHPLGHCSDPLDLLANQGWPLSNGHCGDERLLSFDCNSLRLGHDLRYEAGRRFRGGGRGGTALRAARRPSGPVWVAYAHPEARTPWFLTGRPRGSWTRAARTTTREPFQCRTHVRSCSWLHMDMPQTTSAQTHPRPWLCSTRTQFLILTHRLTCHEGRGNNNSYHYCFGLEDPVERLVLRKAAGGQVSGIERTLPPVQTHRRFIPWRRLAMYLCRW